MDNPDLWLAFLALFFFQAWANYYHYYHQLKSLSAYCTIMGRVWSGKLGSGLMIFEIANPSLSENNLTWQMSLKRCCNPIKETKSCCYTWLSHWLFHNLSLNFSVEKQEDDTLCNYLEHSEHCCTPIKESYEKEDPGRDNLELMISYEQREGQARTCWHQAAWYHCLLTAPALILRLSFCLCGGSGVLPVLVLQVLQYPLTSQKTYHWWS